MGKRKRTIQTTGSPVSTPVKCGCRVILKGGTGPKQKHNGLEASVLEYPRRGSWMTVGLASSCSPVKWRKGHCTAIGTVRTKQRLREVLQRVDDDVWRIVFGFLSGSHDWVCDVMATKVHPAHAYGDRNRRHRSESVWVKDAMRIHSTLTDLSETLGRLCGGDLHAFFGRMNANFDGMKTEEVVPCIRWMIQHKAAIGSLVFYADYGDFAMLEELLHVCDTSGVTFVRARSDPVFRGCWSRGSVQDSQWITHAYKSEHQSPRGTRQVCDIDDSGNRQFVPLKEMCAYFDIPYSSHPSLHNLHHAIALNCPNLSEIEVNINIPKKANLHHHLSAALFSSHKIRRLDLSLPTSNPHLSTIIERTVENLTNLEELSLRSTFYSFGKDKTIHLRLPKLRSLDVRGMVKKNHVRGEFTRLETLKFRGNQNFETVIPKFRSREDLTRARIAGRRRGVDIYFRAGQVKLFGLNLPPDCECFGEDCDSNFYESYREALVPESILYL